MKGESGPNHAVKERIILGEQKENSMLMTGIALAGVLATAQKTDLVIKTGNSISPDYHWTTYESACGKTVFQVRFRNGPDESGRVEYLLIDGGAVRDAAQTLQIRAARRGIDSIEIMDCGYDPQRPVFRGTMRLSKAASQVARLRDALYFRLTREGKIWRLSVD